VLQPIVGHDNLQLVRAEQRFHRVAAQRRDRHREQLQQRGIRVGVVSRGYGGKAERYPLVLTDRTSTAAVRLPTTTTGTGARQAFFHPS
jgi:hypothetical protein